MLTALRNLPNASAALPFVMLWYGQPSSYLWEDDEGRAHTIRQAEGGEQGDERRAHTIDAAPLHIGPAQRLGGYPGQTVARGTARRFSRRLVCRSKAGAHHRDLQHPGGGAVATRPYPDQRWQNAGLESGVAR